MTGEQASYPYTYPADKPMEVVHTDPSQWDLPSAAIPVPITQAQEPAVDVMENETMLREFLAKITDKLVSASSLAKRVEELAAEVKTLHDTCDTLRAERNAASDAKAVAERDKARAEQELAQERAYTKECEAEIEKLKAQLADAQSALTYSRESVQRFAADAFEAQDRLDKGIVAWGNEREQLEQTVHTLQEANQRMENRIGNMVRALQS